MIKKVTFEPLPRRKLADKKYGMKYSQRLASSKIKQKKDVKVIDCNNGYLVFK